MKKSRVVLSLVFTMLAGMAFPGCLDVETKTRVNRDGTLTRTVLFTGDSGSVFRGGYPLTVDSLWPSSIRKLEERKFEFSASRTFSNAEELNTAMKAVPYKTLSVQVELEESFWWFVTDYHYKETYKRWNPFDNVPLTDYLSQAEIDLAMRHEVEDEPFNTKGDSLALTDAGDRFEEWDVRNIFEAYFAVFLGGVRNLHDPSLQLDTLVARKEVLFTGMQNPIHQGKYDTLMVIFGKVMKTRMASKVLAANASEYDILEKQLEFKGAIGSNTYKVSVEMPGIITETNAKSIEGNTVRFSDFMQVAYVKDHEMWVTSRVINWWAVLLTAAIVVLGNGTWILRAVVSVVGKRRK